MFSILRHLNKSSFCEKNTGASFSNDSSSTTTTSNGHPGAQSSVLTTSFECSSHPSSDAVHRLLHKVGHVGHRKLQSNQQGQHSQQQRHKHFSTLYHSSAQQSPSKRPHSTLVLKRSSKAQRNSSKNPQSRADREPHGATSSAVAVSEESTQMESPNATGRQIVEEKPLLFLPCDSDKISWEIALGRERCVLSSRTHSDHHVPSAEQSIIHTSEEPSTTWRLVKKHSHSNERKSTDRNSDRRDSRASNSIKMKNRKDSRKPNDSVKPNDSAQTSASIRPIPACVPSVGTPEVYSPSKLSESHERNRLRVPSDASSEATGCARFRTTTNFSSNNRRPMNAKKRVTDAVGQPTEDNPVFTIGLLDFDPAEVLTERAGIVLVVENHGTLLFGLARDRKYQEITDFGGGVSFKRDKTSYFAAFRELYEESLQSLYLDPYILFANGPSEYNDPCTNGNMHANDRPNNAPSDGPNVSNDNNLEMASLLVPHGPDTYSPEQVDSSTSTSIEEECSDEEKQDDLSEETRSIKSVADWVRPKSMTAAMTSALCAWNPGLSFAVYNRSTLLIGAWLENVTFSEINEHYASRLMHNPRAETDAIVWFTLNDIQYLCQQSRTPAPSRTCSNRQHTSSFTVPTSYRIAPMQIYNRIKPLVSELAIAYRQVWSQARNKD